MYISMHKRITWVAGACLVALLLGSALMACKDKDGDGDGGPTYDPWMVMDASELPELRGWVVKRGIIHCHSPYSHDACDGDPRIDGERNEGCFNDVRRGMCVTGQDFVFMTDHDDLYAEFDYPEVLLYAPGDELIERGGLPVANRVNCGDGHSVILAAGTESAMMPIGVEHHVGDTLEERMAAYNTVSATAIRALQDAGGLVLLQHTEEWDVDQVIDLPIDGIEVYNIHFNMMDNLSLVLQLGIDLVFEPELMPEPEVGMLGVFLENEADLYAWSMAVMHKPMPAFLATDAHQNVMADPVKDGERLDSFRRMMRWFSNYVLVPSGPVDDLVLKTAIGHGRTYGAFDYLGYPVGFDFHATAGETVYEMGDQSPPGTEVTLHVTVPAVWRLDPKGLQPDITVHLYEADNGDWIEVASGTEALAYTTTEGVYRAEVRMVPHHLTPWLGPTPQEWVHEVIWIYANPIYIGTELPMP